MTTESSFVAAHPHRRFWNAQILAGAFLLTLGLAVTMPWLRRGYLLAYDWISGPHDRVPPAAFGHQVGIAGFTPLVLARRTLRSVFLGVDPVAIAILLGPFILGLAFARLKPKAPVAWVAAATLASVNPFIYGRLGSGSFGFVLGVFVTPWLAWQAFQVARGQRRAIGWLAVLFVLQVAGAPQFLLLSGVVVVAMFVAGLASGPVSRRGVSAVLATAVVLPMLMSYWLVPTLSAGLPVYSSISQRDLQLFETRSDSSHGLALNVLGLFGYWRQEMLSAKPAGWLALLAGIFLVILTGVWSALRRPESRPIAVGIAMIGAIGFFLALGHRGPLGELFLWMYDHVPGFRVMREPHKSLALTVIAYAFFYGHGTIRLLQMKSGPWMRGALTISLLGLPITYGSAQFAGLQGYMRPSSYPASWHQADAIMGAGNEMVLVLPWHHFVAFPWTERVVDNPARVFFAREAVTGDNIELGPLRTQSANPRSHYLEFLYSKGIETKDFGNLVAPLGIKYVLVAKEEDWRAYDWLFLQRDLRVVREWDDLVLFENTVDAPIVYAPKQSVTVEDWGVVVGLASQVRLMDYAIEVRHPGPGPVEIPAVVRPNEPFDPVGFESTKPVRYEIESSSSAPYLVLSELFDEKWAYRGKFARRNLGVTNLFVSGPEPGTDIFFTRWTLVRTGYLISGTTFLGLIGWLLYDWVRRRKRLSPAAPMAVEPG